MHPVLRGSVLGQGTRSHWPLLKTLHAIAKTQCSQTNHNKKKSGKRNRTSGATAFVLMGAAPWRVFKGLLEITSVLSLPSFWEPGGSGAESPGQRQASRRDGPARAAAGCESGGGLPVGPAMAAVGGPRAPGRWPGGDCHISAWRRVSMVGCGEANWPPM